jgi:hypothetical protein
MSVCMFVFLCVCLYGCAYGCAYVCVSVCMQAGVGSINTCLLVAHTLGQYFRIVNLSSMIVLWAVALHHYNANQDAYWASGPRTITHITCSLISPSMGPSPTFQHNTDQSELEIRDALHIKHLLLVSWNLSITFDQSLYSWILAISWPLWSTTIPKCG